MIFIDAIAMTTKFYDQVRHLVGSRAIRYREAGDIDREGNPVVETEIIGENHTSAWIQGSHDTRIQLKCDGRSLTLCGNPGRFGRSDNLFNLDLDATVAAANRIAMDQGYPTHRNGALPFYRGERQDLVISQLEQEVAGKTIEQAWTGSRVWSIHITENLETGAYDNVRPTIDWFNTQSVARVKKSRLGATTVVWGSIKYCQVEIYGKADEMMAHCKTPEAKKAMKENPAYVHARDRGIIRVEVKCAKDFLRERNLTYLGNLTMEKVIEIFKEKTEVVERLKNNRLETADDAWLEALPKASRVYAKAWMAGIDVTAMMSRASYFRHAKVLRELANIDISEKRNIHVMQPTMKTLPLQVAEAPAWYQLAA